MCNGQTDSSSGQWSNRELYQSSDLGEARDWKEDPGAPHHSVQRRWHQEQEGQHYPLLLAASPVQRTAEAPAILPDVTRERQDDLGISLPSRIQSPDRLGQRRTTARRSDTAKCLVQIPQGLLSKSRKDDGTDREDARYTEGIPAMHQLGPGVEPH